MPVRRLLLFDIDGTLVRAGEVGGAVFDRAIEAVLGEAPTRRVSMSGKTDPQIVREYLALLDRDDPAHLPAVLERLEAELAAASEEIARQGRPCAGAPELLQALAGTNGFTFRSSRATSPQRGRQAGRVRARQVAGPGDGGVRQRP